MSRATTGVAPAIVWFRSDLRLSDHPALRAAVSEGGAVIPVFIWAPGEEGAWAPGSASRWWFHRSLDALDRALRKRGSRLTFLRGSSLEALRSLAARSGARTVYFNHRYEPASRARDETVMRGLRRDGITITGFNGSLLFEPSEIRTAAGGAYQVYTPFRRACLAAGGPPHPKGAPRGGITAPEIWPKGSSLSRLELDPRASWTAGLEAEWQPGEASALKTLRRFVSGRLESYGVARDLPDRNGTSRLSPHLRFGEISPRQIWHTLEPILRGRGGVAPKAPQSYSRQLLWREFAYHLLYHFPHTTDRPLRPDFARLPRNRHGAALAAWKKGRTGFPIVDAGMRELWATGWMHNRVRMVVASFLVKDLLVPWQTGAKWFWETLVDADLANNTLGWQWTAGCGADAAPFFRIFNPVRQGMRFDPEGAYVRRWIPEIARLPDRWVHRPFEAPDALLAEAGIASGSTYRRPIVDHHERRAVALSAYRKAVSRPRIAQ